MTFVSPGRVTQPRNLSPFAPRGFERVMQARHDLRLGVPILLHEGGRIALVMAVEMLTAERLAAIAAIGASPHIALTAERLARLGCAPLDDGMTPAVLLPASADLAMIRALADPGLRAKAVPRPDLRLEGAELVAGTALHRAAIALAKSAQLLPAALVVPLQNSAMADAEHALRRVEAQTVLSELTAARLQSRVATAALPMSVHQTGRVHVFRPDDASIEHYAIEIGTPDLSAPVLVRLHSACFTGDVFGSLKCDCGPQLDAACKTMARAGGGVVLYLNQEGRGIGMANKMRAYALQDQGLDTVEANHHLGFRDDERDFRNGAALLGVLGVTAVRLLTNNPAKVAILEEQGITVTERVPLIVGKTAQNAQYLATKAAKSGHLLK